MAFEGGEQKYRILQVHNFYQISGGEDAVVANEKKLMEDNGHTVIQYTRNNNEIKKFGIIRKLFLPFATIFNWKTYRDIKYIIMRDKIDIVHVHNTLTLVSPAVFYAALRCKVPVILTIHNFRLLCPAAVFYRDGHICEDCLEKGLGCAIKHKCYRDSRAQTLLCVLNALIHRATGVYKKINFICLTEFNKRKLLNLRQIKETQIYVKPNFVTGEIPLVSYKDRANQMVFVGRLDETKGIRILLEAWRELGEETSELMVYGDGPLEKWCKDFVAENGIKRVRLHGWVSNIEVRQAIARSKALILPTRLYEGFPMTIAEAYAVGTPVIGSDIGNVGNLIEDGISGFRFAVDSLQGLINAVRKVGLRNMGVSRKFNERYSAKQNYEMTLRIYGACINKLD